MFKSDVIMAILMLLAMATIAICAGTPNASNSTLSSVTSVPINTTVHPDDIRPNDMAPGEMPQGGIPPAGASPSSFSGMPPGGSSGPSSYVFSGVYILDGEAAAESKANYTSNTTNTSAFYVINGGDLTLIDPMIMTSGNSSSNDASSFYGLNAAVLATSSSKVDITGGTVTTTGSGANGVFATGKHTMINLTDVSINCSGDGGHGVDATLEGTLQLKDVDIITFGAHGAAIATDRGSGTINATGGMITTYGMDSPGIYSTGAITVNNAVVKGVGSEAAVIEGANSITLANTSLTSGRQTTGRIMIYQSFSGDAENGTGTFVMNDGSISVPVGPIFFVTNTNAVIKLKGVKVASASGTLINASATNRWGRAGSNGARVSFTADDEALVGNLVCDNVSSIAAGLQNGTILAGAMNVEDTGKLASLTLDASSAWNVTGTSHLTGLKDGDTALTNIHSNGFTVYYDSGLESNSWLGGKTYGLASGGKLTPKV
jgi:hypothetical protein